MNYVQGTIRQSLFFNEENSYSVLKVEINDTNDPSLLFFEPTIVVCGFFPKLETGVNYKFFGTVKSHPKYGIQYNAMRYERQIDNTREGIIDYLSSDLFKGIGPKTAARIVDAIGNDALDQIVNNPQILNRVSRLSQEIKTMLPQQLLINRQAESTLVWLYGFQISPKMAMRIFSKYGYKTVDVIKQNPYLLMDEVEGIGFKRADEIGLKIGFAFDNPLRIRAVILYLLGEYVAKYGDTLLEKEKIIAYASAFLKVGEDTFVEVEAIENTIKQLIDEHRIIEKDALISLEYLYRAEEEIAKLAFRYSNTSIDEFDIALINQYIIDFEKRNGIDYTENQKDAIITALHHPLTIITGGPGTGKTTIIKGVVAIFQQMHQGNREIINKIKLAAPTGKAAKRLSEATGLEATTIHRLLGFDFEGHYTFDEHNPLETKLLIIDEASMMDVLLAKQLFSALKTNTKILIVGDENQLPSVGPGQVLADLLGCDLFPVVRLVKIHRQAADSSIIRLAYDILNQNLSENVLSQHSDRSYIRANETMVPNIIIKVIKEAIEAGFDLWEDIQILIPMYKGISGIDHINSMIQSTFNIQNKDIKIGYEGKFFCLKDKILQLVNQPEDGIMNGDIGIVSEILDDKEMLVDFSGNIVKYNIKDFDNLTLAYAISVHKAQGSEYKVVILPLVRSQSILLKRKLLYTAVTRAKERLMLIGEYQALKHGILGIEMPRKTLLKTFLINQSEGNTPDFLTIEDFM
ncbi:MAG: ATP-dependent RecD-like DNA helicase [Candidatus Izemoplasmatales bacterium]